MKRNRKPGKREGRAEDSSGKVPRVIRARRAWVLLVGVAICAGIIGLFVAGPFWRTDRASQEKAKPPAASLPPLPGPVSKTQATIEALRKEALQVASSLLEDFPNSSDSAVLMGNLHNSLGNSAEARKCWEKCLKADPDRGDAYHALGMIALRKAEYRKALALWRKALEIDPKMARVRTFSARALMGLGRPKEAVAALEEDVTISPGSSVSYFELGQAYRQLKEYDKAKKSYEAAIAIQADYTNAYYGLALACARLGQGEKSREYMDKFKKLKAENKDADKNQRSAYDDVVSMRQSLAQTRTDAGRVYRGHGNLQKAEELWRRAATLDPQNTACRMELVSLYIQDNRVREALRMCEQLKEIEPDNAVTYLNIGVLNARLNQLDAALSAVERAIALDPDNPEYRRAYKLIQERK